MDEPTSLTVGFALLSVLSSIVVLVFRGQLIPLAEGLVGVSFFSGLGCLGIGWEPAGDVFFAIPPVLLVVSALGTRWTAAWPQRRRSSGRHG